MPWKTRNRRSERLEPRNKAPRNGHLIAGRLTRWLRAVPRGLPSMGGIPGEQDTALEGGRWAVSAR